ncbi:hypothetical protein GUITHDRAFT_113430 [Guillardia theta CCMP2712]|uniref:BHLH domain-containing protein n=1 Tax=Guillardia theta (strain CCMP2712) TaxID=905079 RepID=L1IX19_GUITC|nr:hypothetical protein GUITHDRAFT_113430 [Guillardia theta CCMP2712]EKX40400.1 hypothetical protein GUITHDRAFT_113430 [Guillardia theta CCMP2712]|eukprot:XP_005827380.1 hypothetical protein GUITHDRAFT_113430 [Guillardia theta CCMP2712]
MLQDDLKSNSEEEQYRKEKHKVVEQKRREKTKELLADLQDLLPNLDSTNSAALTMNTVLQCAIDFLSKNASNVQTQSSGNGTNGGAEGALGVSANDIEQESNDIDLKLSHGSSAGVHVRISHGFDGHSVCRCADGTIQEVNPAFAAMLGYGADQRYKLIGRTFFSLVSPQDMQNTLKAVSQLLSGELNHIPLTQNCVRQDGTTASFNVEMNCLWKNNKAHCIVCFMRPSESGPGASGQDMGGMNQNQQMPQGQPLLPMTSGFPGVLQGMGPMPGNPGMPGRPSLVQGGGRRSKETERGEAEQRD